MGQILNSEQRKANKEHQCNFCNSLDYKRICLEEDEALKNYPEIKKTENIIKTLEAVTDFQIQLTALIERLIEAFCGIESDSKEIQEYLDSLPGEIKHE